MLEFTQWVNLQEATKTKHGYVTNIEDDTIKNNDYRKVLYTSKYSQLVLMNLKPGEEIGEEIHGVDQFFRCERGSGKAILDGAEHLLEDGSAVVIPAGTRHNIVNDSKTEDMKLYTIYSPPHHRDGIVLKTKGQERPEEYDGGTSF